jgi:hypothetical protein
MKLITILAAFCLAASVHAGQIIVRTAAATNENPAEAGKAAARALKTALAGAEPQIVLAFDCFEDKANKQKLLDAVATVFPKDKIHGGAAYGMFTQAGSLDDNGVTLLAIGGDGVTVRVAFTEKMGAAGLTLEKDAAQLTKALNTAGAHLAQQLPGIADASLLLLISDAHSPKNQLLIDGVQSVAGKKLRITGGSVNKNAGQNWVYHRGQVYTDSAIAVTLKGEFTVAQTGRQAKDNDAVLATAKEGSALAVTNLKKPPFAVIIFDCAGRKGKLKNLSDELAAIQTSIGKTVPLFGCYCAGEYGPADATDLPDPTACYGRGWHVMVSALGQ